MQNSPPEEAQVVFCLQFGKCLFRTDLSIWLYLSSKHRNTGFMRRGLLAHMLKSDLIGIHSNSSSPAPCHQAILDDRLMPLIFRVNNDQIKLGI
jgi:hypothetical protein